MKAIEYLKNFSDSNKLKKVALELLEKELYPNEVEVFLYIEEAGELVPPGEEFGITLPALQAGPRGRHAGMGIIDLWEAEFAYVPPLPQGHPAAIDNDKYQDMSEEDQTKASKLERAAAMAEAKKSGVKIKTFNELLDQKPEEDDTIKIKRQFRALVI